MANTSDVTKFASGGGRYNPFVPLQNELSKIIRNFHGWIEPFNFTLEHFENLAMAPALDIIDEKDTFKIKSEMPGIEKEDVKISINDGVLTIEGEKMISKQDKDKDKSYIVREINWGHYKRQVILPSSIDIDKTKASFKNGILWIEIPKKIETAKESRVIEVENL